MNPLGEVDLIVTRDAVDEAARQCPDMRRRCVLDAAASCLTAWVQEKRADRDAFRLALVSDTIGGPLEERLHSVKVTFPGAAA